MSQTNLPARDTTTADNSPVLSSQYRRTLTSNASGRDALALALLVMAWAGAIWFLSGQ